eukprot:12444395-Prorocentrum_lima.AAC.1
MPASGKTCCASLRRCLRAFLWAPRPIRPYVSMLSKMGGAPPPSVGNAGPWTDPPLARPPRPRQSPGGSPPGDEC